MNKWIFPPLWALPIVLALVAGCADTKVLAQAQ